MEIMNIHIPFQFTDGEFYSIIHTGDVGSIFISNGKVLDYPNGDDQQFIEYRVYALVMVSSSVFKPLILAGPDIDGHGGCKFSRNLGVRYATEDEKQFLLQQLKKKKFAWDNEGKRIVKLKKSRIKK